MRYLLVAVAFLPLLMANSVFFPFITGKVVFLRGLVAAVSVWFFITFLRNKSFQETMADKMRVLCKNPIFVSLAAYFIVFTATAASAENPFWAFWGSIERGEGVVGMLFFFGFFLFSLLLFQNKEWLYFFKLTLPTSVILFIHAVVQASQGADRPASFTGHPTYLGAYFIFVIWAAYLVWLHVRRTERLWGFFALIILLMSFVGIFVTRTRGALVGLAAGFLATLIYTACFGKEIAWKKFHLRRLSLALLLLLFCSGGIFVATRSAPLWQHIPGLNRLAVISRKDPTTESRILTARVALRTVDPREGNLKRLLVGWGAENFAIAWHKYYDPRIYINDPTTLDRAHNKVLDALVMNGIFGLLSYVAIWFFAFKALFKRGKGGEEIALRSALIFFGVSYFTQNLFVFDSVTTYVPFFVFLAFLIFLQTPQRGEAGRALRPTNVGGQPFASLS